MITELSAYLGICLIYLSSFPLGYLILRMSKLTTRNGVSLVTYCLICVALGLSTLSVVLLVIGLFLISANVLVAIIILSSALAAIELALQLKKNPNIAKKLHCRLLRSDNIVPLILLVLTLLRFGGVVGTYGWPPVGDAMEHGLITSLFITNGRVRLDYFPLSSAPLEQPTLGFHATAASFSLLYNILPGESVFLLAAAILVLIPLLLYSLTHLVTTSVILSILAFLSSFMMYGGVERYVVGYFWNGPYPNLWGYMGIILFCVLLYLRKVVRVAENGIRSYVPLLLVMAHLLVTYPPFFFFPAIYLALRANKTSINVICKIVKRRWIQILILVLVFSFLVFAFQNYTVEIVNLFTLKLGKVLGRSFRVSPDIYVGTGIVIPIATLISFFFLYVKKYFDLALFYVIIVIPCFLSTLDIFPFIAIFLPSRSVVIAFLLSWVLIFVLCSHEYGSNGFTEPKKRQSVSLVFLSRKFTHDMSIHFPKYALVFILALILFTPDVITNFTQDSGWFQLTSHSDDYDVLLWTHEHVPSNSLILNDYSFPSRFLTSFSVMNVTLHHHLNTEYDSTRAIECHSYWKNPSNYALFHNLVTKYNIEYVLVTSVSSYKDSAIFGGDNQYKPKPYREKTRFVEDANPYLEIAYDNGFSAIYKVVDEPELISTVLFDDNWSEFTCSLSGSGGIALKDMAEDTTFSISGNNSLKIQLTAGNASNALIRSKLSPNQDWSEWEYLVFYWLGNHTGNEVLIRLSGSTSYDYCQYFFYDSWSGWERVIIPLNAPFFAYGDFDISNVITVQLNLVEATANDWHIDKIMLAKRAPET